MNEDIIGLVKQVEELLYKLPEPEFDKLAMGLQVVILNQINQEQRLDFLKDAIKVVKKAQRIKKLQEGTKKIMSRVTKQVIEDAKKGYVGQDEIPFVLKERLKSEGVTSKINMTIIQKKGGKKSVKVVDTDEGD